MAQDNIDQISDAEVFNDAIADTPKEAPEPVSDSKTSEPATPEVEGTKGERVRDEKGRFTAKAETQEEIPAEAETPAKEDRTEHHIPSWRLREEAEARRESERRTAQLESMLAQYEQRLQALQPKPEPQQFPDIFTEPDQLPQYFNQMLEQERAKWQQEMRATVANMSLQRAHDKHGESFMQAFNEITARPISDPLRQQVINSPDPGETLVNLWKREQTLAEVGNDPVIYRQKILDEALSNPEFLEKAIEAARAKAGASPASKVVIPPSISKAAPSARSSDSSGVSDADIFHYATRR